MNLPSDYLFLRQNAAGCGTYQKHTTFNDDGATSRLGTRPPNFRQRVGDIEY